LAETTTQAARRIRVEDPATGRLTAIVDVVAPEHIPELLARARAAQPGWNALGFEGRNELFGRAQKWMVDNRERVIRTIVSETGKAWEEAQLAELAYVAGALGSGESTRARSSRRRRSGPRRPSSWAQAHAALRPGWRGGRDRPLELSAHPLIRRCDSRHGGGQRCDRQAQRGHPTVRDADGRGAARVRPAWRRVVTRFAPKRDLHMLPYSSRRTKLIERIIKRVYGRPGR
jgi:hypothetical protein